MHTRITLAAVLCGSAAVASAANSTSPIVVTATRTAQTVDETLASVTVIDRNTIEQSQAASVMELLQSRSVGLDVVRNGGPGTTTSVMLRGSNSNHVLVLIDGVRANSGIDGGFKWSNLPPEQIERIEIVRGPRSTLYGSDAIGGVIQIFTRRTEGPHFAIGGGSYHTRRFEAGTGGTLGQGSFSLNAGYRKSEGFSATNPDGFGYDPDKDGYEQRNLGLGISHPVGNDAALSLKLLRSDGQSDIDSGSSEQRNDSASLALDWHPTTYWQSSVRYGRAYDRYEADNGYLTRSTRDSLNWQNDLQLGLSGLLTLGLDYQDDRGESDGSYDETSDSTALYGQYQWYGESFDLQLGARRDDYSGFGGHNTGNLTLGSHLGDGRLYLSYSTAFKAPTFLQRYYPNYGNPNLLPEESVSLELGYRLGGFRASLYETEVDNLIEFTFPDGYANVSRARTRGLELEYARPIGSWQLNGGVTLQRAENRDTETQLLRRAEEKLFLNAHGPLSPKSDLGIEANYVGPRMDRGDIELDAYTLVNLTGSYHLNKQWRLKGRIENLLDEEYAQASGYNTPETSAYLTLSYQAR